ncbi:hypothetical protein ColTof4_14343 [Colletotrichum tofieldiae]|nr:hypothetical protein ColTof3_14754 [Colletotrichum tofieldiae]GKT81920.1 hypothetical protein ColTof4_14343 [Colletotrichum tofieldiae]
MAVVILRQTVLSPSSPISLGSPQTTTGSRQATKTHTAPSAIKSVCRAHRALSDLPFSSVASWPLLTEFISVDVKSPPFALYANADSRHGGTSSSRPVSQTSPGDAMKNIALQKMAILHGWTRAYEGLLGGPRSSQDQEIRPVANVMMLVAVTLQDVDNRLLYVYTLLPQMEKAAEAALKRRHGRGKRAAAQQSAWEREKKEIMKDWLKDMCIADGTWERE